MQAIQEIAKTAGHLTVFQRRPNWCTPLHNRPITDDEMQMAHDTLIQRLPNQFSSVSAIGATITSLYVQDLPADYYQNYAKAVRAVTKEDVLRVAKKYIDLNHLNIVIVGDRASVEGPLKATGIAPIVLLDQEGRQKS